MKTRRLKFLSIVSACLLVVLLFSGSVGAGIWIDCPGQDGGLYRTGYFMCEYMPNNYDRYSTTAGYVIAGGLYPATLTADSIKTKLKEVYDGADYRNKVGASYIVHSMLGYQQNFTDPHTGSPAKDAKIVVTTDEWDDLLARMQATDISISNSYAPTSDVGMNTNIDVFRVDYGYGSGDSYIIFKEKGTGTILYAIKQLCANPDGSLPDGLPAQNWEVDASAVVKVTKTSPGETITWTHTVTNNGPTKTDRDVIYYYQHSDGLSTAQGTNQTFASGKAPSVSNSYDSYHTITQADVGKTLCRRTYATPRSVNNGVVNNGPDVSTPACVFIPYNWKITVSAEAKVGGATATTASPGEKIIWTHTATNNGPTKTDRPIAYSYQNSDGLGTGTGTSTSILSGLLPSTPSSKTSEYPVTQDDVGKNLCRATVASPSAWNNVSSTVSTPACVDIPYNYTLNPSVSFDVLYVAETDTPYAVFQNIDNAGPTKSRPFEWQLSFVKIKPSSLADNEPGGNSTTDPCNYFNNANADCKPKNSGNDLDGIPFGDNMDDLNDHTDVVEGTLEPGTRLCYALSIKPYSSAQVNNNEWRHSKLTCIKIGKKPKVQVWGGNVVSGGLISTSTTVKKDASDSKYKLFGSWGEYGVFAVSSISGMASGSALAGTVDLGNSSSFKLCDYSKLSFSNALDEKTPCKDDVIGGYTFGTDARDPSINFTNANTIDAGTITIDINSLPTSDGLYVGEKTGDLILTSSILQAGKTIILKVNGNVTIEGNLSYENITYTDASNLPQLIISAKNIYINSDVKNIDAWLISRGVIDTCKNFSGDYLTINKCNFPLVVNGPVITNKLLLNRTAGSGVAIADSDDPAEIFNLRADAFLWATSRAARRNVVYTVYLNELPPRF